ncbi:hypothetical protein D9M71_765380 [compost metagenome]
MEQHCIVTGLGDGQVKTRIGSTFLCPADFILTGVTVLQSIERLFQALAIRLCRTGRRVIGAGRLQRMSELQQVALGFRVTFEQLQQRIAEGRAQ